MEDGANQHEPLQSDASESDTNGNPELLTVSQAYNYLISAGLPRSKKTIRKWCRLNHVDWKEIAVPGGAKWLITKNSLDARIAEERLIDASLRHDTGSNLSDGPTAGTGANRSAPVRNDALIKILKEQLGYEREARSAAETKNRELIDKYHEISLASAQMGIEIGKGMQEQARTRRLAVHSETDPNPPIRISDGSRFLEPGSPQDADSNEPLDPGEQTADVDNLDPASDSDLLK